MVKRFVEVSSRVLLTLVLATLSGLALAQADQQKLVDQADATLRNFMRDPQMTWLHDNIGKGHFVGPAFYTLATASVGFQAGVAVSEVVTLVMTDRGMRSLLATSVKLGGDIGIAAGPVGAGASGEVISDLVSFSRSKGVYG